MQSCSSVTRHISSLGFKPKQRLLLERRFCRFYHNASVLLIGQRHNDCSRSISSTITSTLYRSQTITPSYFHPSNSLGSSATTQRNFSSQNNDNTKDDEVEKLLQKRNHTLLMNPKGYSHAILPNKFIYKTNERTGETKKVSIERTMGYFWEMKDMKDTDGKPILSHDALVPLDEAELFPDLEGLMTLTGEDVSLPDFLMRRHNHRGDQDPNFCTLVGIAYKDFGYQKLTSWLDPIQNTLSSNTPVEVVRIAMNEGFFFRLLKPLILRGMRNKTPDEYHASTLTYFGTDTESFRDILRMHNSLTCYVILVDKFGRVRWMGSGDSSDEERRTLVRCIKELVQVEDYGRRERLKGKGGRTGKKIPH